MATGDHGRRAARGTIALVLSRGGFFLFGYLVVVVLARSFGPTDYGTYGVIMALLVWLEQSGLRAVPSATTKLLAESAGHAGRVERSALALNFGLHLLFFAVLWMMAPWLAAWFGIDNGAFLIRIAAIDLPLFGIYTALQAIHQGHHRYLRLGLVEVGYALAKLLGVLIIAHIGISLAKAFVVNALATVAGIAFLLPRTRFWSQTDWLTFVRPITLLAVPMGLYAITQLLTSWLDLWILKMMLPGTEAAMVGIYLGALNIARVPGFALSAVSTVLLPSVSQANARSDRVLVEHYVQQALRFLLMAFVPILIVLSAQPEALMLLVYGDAFADGGRLLPILVVAHGFWAVHAILASVLIALGQVRVIAIIAALSIVPACGIFAGAIGSYGALGAAFANVVVPAAGCVIFGVLLWTRIGAFLPWRSIARIGVAGLLGQAFSVLLADGPLHPVSLCLAALVVYGAALLVSREVRQDDFAILLPLRLGR